MDNFQNYVEQTRSKFFFNLFYLSLVEKGSRQYDV